jgi:hydrogenase maturation protease
VHLLCDALPPDRGGALLTLVVGVGNAWRGDDAAGLEVARRLRERPAALELRELDGAATALLELWEGHAHVAVVDAAVSGAAPGTLHAFRADRRPLPVTLRSSTHAFGVADAIELARALGRLPARLDVYALEGEAFGLGAPLTPAVARGVDGLAARLAAAPRSPGFSEPGARVRPDAHGGCRG